MRHTVDQAPQPRAHAPAGAAYVAGGMRLEPLFGVIDVVDDEQPLPSAFVAEALLERGRTRGLVGSSSPGTPSCQPVLTNAFSDLFRG
jgi:hypothetical protein